MMRFAEFIANRKAWQIFVALVGPLLAAQAMLMEEIAVPAHPTKPTDIEEFNRLFQTTIWLGFFLSILMLAWFLAIGFASNRRISASIRPSMRWYLAAAIYVPTYFVAAGSLFFPQILHSNGPLSAMVVVLHLVATAAMFYLLGFTAKNLIMAERQSTATFFDYSGPFFLLWFFPIGVWFVQPRVNRLLEKDAQRI